MGKNIMVGFEPPQFLDDYVTEENPISEKYPGRQKTTDELKKEEAQHFARRYGTNVDWAWNIGFIAFGGVNEIAFDEILKVKKSRAKLNSNIGDFYIATGVGKEGNVKETKRKVKYTLKAITDEEELEKSVLGLEWKDLESPESRKTLDTIVQNTNICVIAADDVQKFKEICARGEGIPEDDIDRRREAKTMANLEWVKEIAPRFRDYDGIVLMVSNLSDDLAYAFAYYSGMDPHRIVGLNHADTDRLTALKGKVREGLIDLGGKITENFPELTTGGAEVLDDIDVFSVGTHNDPYPLVYYKGGPYKLNPGYMEEVRDELKTWGFKVIKDTKGNLIKGATARETGQAVKETVIQIMEGLEPISVSVLFDYCEAARDKQGFFAVPVMFDVDPRQNKDGGTTFVPRPRVVKSYVDFLLKQEEFRELLDQHADWLRSQTDENGMPMFPIIKDVIVDPPGGFDLGDLYAVSDDGTSLNRYFLTDKNGTELDPKKISLLGLEGFTRCRDGRLSCTLEMKTRPRKNTRAIVVIEDDRVVNRIGPFEEEILHTGLALDNIYASFRSGRDSKIVRFEPGNYSVIDLEKKVNDGVHVKGEVYAMDMTEDGVGLLFYSAGGSVFCSDLQLQNPRPFAETGTEIGRLKILPKARLVIGADDEKLHIWDIDNPEEGYTSFDTNGSYCDVYVRNREITVAYASEGGISLEVFKSKEELFSREEGSEAPPVIKVNTDNLMGLDLLGDYIAAGLIEEGESHLKVFGRDFSQVEDFVINEAEFLGGYEVAER